MSRHRSAAMAASLLLSASCLDVSGANFTAIDFDLTSLGRASGWTVGVADLPAARVAEVEATGEERSLPAELQTTAKSMYQSGSNVTGDLFVFQQKYWDGFRPSTTFNVSLQIAFVTNVHSGCTTGVGPAVVIKAGVTDVEPLATADAQGILRMNIDKGAGPAKGQYVQLGDIRNGLTGCPTTGTYASHTTVEATQSATVTTDGFGGFWIFIGTQSSLAGSRHEVYFTDVQLKFR